MSKELEALNDLIDLLEDEHYGLSENEWVVERTQTIETALERLEILDIQKITFERELKKKLKALEIIKEKFNPIIFEHDFGKHYLKLSKGNTMVVYEIETKEEFDLLKEELI